MSSQSSQRSTDTQIRIVQSAHDLFIRQGYHGTSTRQIASQAGIALGGLYNHFPSKEAVFKSVFEEYHPYHEVLPALLQAQGGDVEELVHSATNRLVQAIVEHPDFLNLMFIEIVEFKSVHAQELMETLIPYGLEIGQRILMANPEKLRPIPLPMLVRSFLGLFFSYYLTELIFAHKAPAEFRQNAMASLADIYLHGILID